MQARIAFPWRVVIQLVPLLWVLAAPCQDVKGTPPAAQVKRSLEAVQPIAVKPVSPVAPNDTVTAERMPASQDAPPIAGSDLLIESGDLLEINLYGIPEFNKEVRVAERGDITLPLIGDVHVAGLTIHSAEALVQRRLVEGGFFTDPQVSITARDSVSQGTSVLGEVQKPGIYFLPGQHSLFDALSAAGGLTPRAGNTITITHRGRPTEVETVKLPPNQTLPAESNVAITQGDTIVVSKAGIVYVLGDVRLPGGFVMENANVTVLQAVAMAQGANTTAKLDRTILIRKSEKGRQEIPVHLSKVMEAKSPDFKLQADDVIFVPRSTVKAGFRRGLEAALETAVGVVIYRPL